LLEEIPPMNMPSAQGGGDILLDVSSADVFIELMVYSVLGFMAVLILWQIWTCSRSPTYTDADKPLSRPVTPDQAQASVREKLLSKLS